MLDFNFLIFLIILNHLKLTIIIINKMNLLKKKFSFFFLFMFVLLSMMLLMLQYELLKHLKIHYKNYT